MIRRKKLRSVMVLAFLPIEKPNCPANAIQLNVDFTLHVLSLWAVLMTLASCAHAFHVVIQQVNFLPPLLL